MIKFILKGLPIIIGSLLIGCNSEEPINDNGLNGVPYETLSEYNFFSDNMKETNPATNLIPYDLTTPLFTDFAQKERFIYIPEGKTVPYNDVDFLEFPVGSMLIKNFYYANDLRNLDLGRKIIETRVLIHFSSGWDAFTYLWNEEQTEAHYSVVGKSETINYVDEVGNNKTIHYVVPNKNDCKGCHNLDNKFSPIGPKARYLNKNYSYPEGEVNILTKLEKDGLLTGLPNLSQVPAGVVWDNPNTGNLDERARTYLDINCAHCHRPTGPANHSGLFLYKHENDPYKLGFCKRPVAAGGGSGGLDYGIVAGSADRSILYYRMNSTNPGEMMPELGRSVNHEEGIALIKEWIDSMEPGECN